MLEMLEREPMKMFILKNESARVALLIAVLLSLLH